MAPLTDHTRINLSAVKWVGSNAQVENKTRTSQAADHAGGSLWILEPVPAQGGPGPGHTHILLLPDTPRAGVPGSTHTSVRSEPWIRHGESIIIDATSNATALIVAEVLCTDHLRETEWDRWYDEQHLPDMMKSNAFIRGTRWHRPEPRPGWANFLTIYEIAGHSVGDAISLSAAIMPGLIKAGGKHECHAGGPTMALQRA